MPARTAEVGTFQELLRGAAKLADRIEEQAAKGETDPLRIVDAMMGGTYSTNAGTETWWELFGRDEKPVNKAQLEGMWREWAARNHPDQGGSVPAFRHMRELFERMHPTLED